MVGPERTLLRDERCYIAHPHMVRLVDGSWLLVATCGPRRAVTLHPPLDPDFVTIGIWSTDEGETWSEPAPIPAPGFAGAECSGLTALPEGSVLLDQWRFRWYEGAEAEDFAVGGEAELTSAADLQQQLDASRELDGPAPPGTISWARGGGALTLWRSDVASRRWEAIAEPALHPYSGGYGLRGGVMAANGDLLLPLTDPPHYRSVFLIRSRDGGRTWSRPESVAKSPAEEFEEPAAILLGSGMLLMLLRENVSRNLHAVRSRDHGATWSAPEKIGVPGFPAHCLALPDGRLAALTALRDAPGTILLSVSPDDGGTWSDAPITVAGDLGTHDLGYPTGVVAQDGSVFAAYYRRDTLGVTGVYARRVAIPLPA